MRLGDGLQSVSARAILRSAPEPRPSGSYSSAAAAINGFFGGQLLTRVRLRVFPSFIARRTVIAAVRTSGPRLLQRPPAAPQGCRRPVRPEASIPGHEQPRMQDKSTKDNFPLRFGACGAIRGRLGHADSRRA